MARIDEMNEEIITQEEVDTSPDVAVGEQNDDKQPGGTLKKGDREAIEAMKKFTDEDDKNDNISIKSILGGDFLMSRFVMKQVLFVMFCVCLILVYTGNRYGSQQDAIKIDSLRNHLQDVKYNVLTQSSELMNKMRQSNVEKTLQSSKDSTLRNPITPPFLIRVNNTNAVAPKETETREILVGNGTAESTESDDSTTTQNNQAKEQQ